MKEKAMLKPKHLNILVGFLASWLVTCALFPLIPGIEFSGSIGTGLLLNVGNTLISWLILGVSLISVIIGGFVYCIRHEVKFRSSSMTRWILKQGFWKVSVGGSALSIVFSCLTWKLTAYFSSSLTIHGFMPIALGVAAMMVITTTFKLVTDPQSLSPSGFRQKLEANLATELAKEAKDDK